MKTALAGQWAGLVDDAVRRIVAEAEPLQVFLFGSAARGGAGQSSDLDLLVVMPDGTDRLEMSFRLHRSLRGLDCPVDIIVVLESEARALRENPSLVIHTAMTEGEEVYHAA
jgi:predicted nucleotidyltransferase